MEIKRIIVGGNREEVDRITGEHTPHLLDSVKRGDLIYTPELLLRKFFKGSDEAYDTWLMKHSLHPSQINYHDIHQKQALIKSLKNYTARLLEEAKTDPLFFNELGNFRTTRWLDTFDILENHIFDLGEFDAIEFMKISDHFKKRFTTHAPFAFLTIDTPNQQLKVVASHKVLLLFNQALPMGNKRGTPSGQEPEKLYQHFFTAIGYKGNGELTEGLNFHRTSFKNFNFNLNAELRILNDIIYEVLSYEREETQIAFLFGAYGKKLYFESDIKGTERKQEELEALFIVEESKSMIEKTLHKERQGSIAVDQTSIEVKKRIEHPKISLPTTEKEETAPHAPVLTQEAPPIKQACTPEKTPSSLSQSLESFEKEIFKKQQGYAELAKEKINEALLNKEQYIKEFHAFLDKGMHVSDALNKFSERYANNPYIKGIIETSITGELQLQHLKDKGIEELQHQITLFESDIQDLQNDLDSKETQIATLNQQIESIHVAHNKQLEEIENNIRTLVEERKELLLHNHQQSEMIGEFETLFKRYEQTLKERENSIELLTRKIENSEMETKHYLRQIEQLKEENRLTLSATNLLKTNNQQLEAQIASLLNTIETLETANKAQSEQIEALQTSQ